MGEFLLMTVGGFLIAAVIVTEYGNFLAKKAAEIIKTETIFEFQKPSGKLARNHKHTYRYK